MCACVRLCTCVCLGLRCLWITERSAPTVEPLLDREHVTGVETVVLGSQYINLIAASLCDAKSAFQQKDKMKNDLLIKKAVSPQGAIQ